MKALTLSARDRRHGAALTQQQDTNFKPATLDNGVEVMVPQFVKTADTIRLDIENLRYMDRGQSQAHLSSYGLLPVSALRHWIVSL